MNDHPFEIPDAPDKCKDCRYFSEVRSVTRTEAGTLFETTTLSARSYCYIEPRSVPRYGSDPSCRHGVKKQGAES